MTKHASRLAHLRFSAIAWLAAICVMGMAHLQLPAQLGKIQTMMASVTLENKAGQPNDTTGISEMTVAPYGCDPEDLRNYHVVDWSGDGQNDLVFNGPCRPYPEVAFMLHTREGLALAYQMGGVLLNIEPTGNGCLAWIYTESVGCLRTHAITEIELDSTGQTLSSTTIEWNPEDTIPQADEYAQVKSMGMLRQGRTINDHPLKDECTGLQVMGNQIFDLQKPVECLLLQAPGDWQMVCAPIGKDEWRIGWIKNSLQNMNANEKTILSLYEGFQQKNYKQMGECYADSATFQDEVFALKNGKECRAMWHYLITNGKDLNVTFRDIKADDKTGSAHWEATYTFSGTGRKVHNVIEARFEFQDGKIVKHRDSFKFWKWTRMALGATGTLLGWTPLVKNKVRKTAKSGLDKFMADKPEYK